MNYVGDVKVTTRVPIRERQEIRVVVSGRRYGHRSRDCNGVPQAKECWQPLEIGRRRTDFP